MKALKLIKSNVLKVYHSRWMNRYMLTLSGFLVWMVFFDHYNLISQWHLTHTVHDLEEAIQDYQVQFEKVSSDQLDLQKHTEQFAREKYLMHKDDEEVFIIQKPE